MELTDIPTEDEIDFEVSQDLEQISSGRVYRIKVQM